MHPYIAELARLCDCYVSYSPNAGPSNPMRETGFDEIPEITARLLTEFTQAGLINLAGGYCGTTPAHLAVIAGARVLFRHG